MSRTTEAILYVDNLYDDEEELYTRITLPIKDEPIQNFEKINMEEAGGYKVFVADVYAASFNYVTYEELKEWFLNLEIDEHIRLILIANREDEDLTLMLTR